MIKKISKNLNAQAASEYFVTYAWVILIILAVIIGLMYYFGMWDFLAPNDCTLATGLTCYDFKVKSSAVQIALFNKLGGIVTINDIDLKDCQGNPQSQTIKDNQKATFIIEPCTITGKKYSSKLNVTYVSENGLEHTARGEIRSQVDLS